MTKEGVTTTMKWENITPDFITFEKKGEFIEGELLEPSVIMIKGVEVMKWQVRDLKDDIVKAFLGGISLDPMLTNVPVGTTIKLEFDGKLKIASGYQVKTFKLYKQIPDNQPEKKSTK